MAFCFVMVFGALLEYATVSYTGKRIKLNQRRFEEFKKKVRNNFFMFKVLENWGLLLARFILIALNFCGVIKKLTKRITTENCQTADLGQRVGLISM